MFGDDPDPTVTIARFGFGEDFGRAREGGSKRGDEGKGRNGNDERMQVLKQDDNEVPMQCN